MNQTTNTTKNPTRKESLTKRLEALAKEYEEKLASLDNAPVCKKTTPAIKDITKHESEYVEIRLFKDGDKYKDDVLVGINGYMCRVKRGVPVKIKRRFAEVIAQSEDNVAKVNAGFLSRDGKMERYC